MKSLKILCISDKIDPLIYSNNIKKRLGNVDLVLSSGDLDLDYYGFIVSSLNKPLFFIFGNHNLKNLHNYRKDTQNPPFSKLESFQIQQKSYGSTYIGDKVVKVKSILIAGLGGSKKYNSGENQYSEVGMAFKILKLLPGMLFHRIFHGRWIDILLTHAPPRNLGDREDRCHQGFKVFRTFDTLFKPHFHLHGHIHLYNANAGREIKFNSTRIINIYEHQIIDIEVP